MWIEWISPDWIILLSDCQILLEFGTRKSCVLLSCRSALLAQLYCGLTHGQSYPSHGLCSSIVLLLLLLLLFLFHSFAIHSGQWYPYSNPMISNPVVVSPGEFGALTYVDRVWSNQFPLKNAKNTKGYGCIAGGRTQDEVYWTVYDTGGQTHID